MTTTHLLISLGTTICVGIFLYFYLKKRTEKIEKKVNLMFQLIQEHEKQARQQAQIMISQKIDPPIKLEETIIVSKEDLISVSEDDYDGDSDDSQEVSDNEDDKIIISNTNVKSSFALNGAEISSSIMTFSIDNLENTEIDSIVSDNDAQSDEQSDGESVENDVVSVKVIELGTTVGDDLDEITLDDPEQQENDTQKSEDEDDNSTNINYAEIKKEVDHLVQNITFQKKLEATEHSKQVNVLESFDLNKLRVPELKSKCEELGLEGYKKLRKGALIDLIESNLK